MFWLDIFENCSTSQFLLRYVVALSSLFKVYCKHSDLTGMTITGHTGNNLFLQGLLEVF